MYLHITSNSQNFRAEGTSKFWCNAGFFEGTGFIHTISKALREPVRTYLYLLPAALIMY